MIVKSKLWNRSTIIILLLISFFMIGLAGIDRFFYVTATEFEETGWYELKEFNIMVKNKEKILSNKLVADYKKADILMYYDGGDFINSLARTDIYESEYGVSEIVVLENNHNVTYRLYLNEEDLKELSNQYVELFSRNLELIDPNKDGNSN